MLSLTLKEASPIPMSSEFFTPDRLAGLDLSGICGLPVSRGNRTLTMGDCFHIEGSLDDDLQMEFIGSSTTIKSIGAKMSRGLIRVHGPAGMHLGSQMTGGKIEVFGNVAEWAGAEMRDGLIRIHGNAADRLGGAYPGSVRGMRGGTILVHGHAGNEVGTNMRRGLIAVQGNVGDFAGLSMIAGSIFIAGKLGSRAGAGMKRGTILTLQPVAKLAPTFRFDCEYEPTFLRLYFRHFRELGFPFGEDLSRSSFRRYSGDILALGKGEILERIG